MIIYLSLQMSHFTTSSHGSGSGLSHILHQTLRLRTDSYYGAINDNSSEDGRLQHQVRAGTQKVIQVFITHAANIFLLSTGEISYLDEQVRQSSIVLYCSLCKDNIIFIITLTQYG